MSQRSLITMFALFGALTCFATQNVDLKAGATVTLDKLADTTIVSCEGAAPAHKCLCVYEPGAGSNYVLQLYPENVKLDGYILRDDCMKALANTQDCH